MRKSIFLAVVAGLIMLSSVVFADENVWQQPAETVVTGQKNCTTKFTAYQLGSSKAVYWVAVKPHPANTGVIYFGDSSITVDNSYIMESTAPVVYIQTDNVSDIWVMSDKNGGRACYTAMPR